MLEHLTNQPLLSAIAFTLIHFLWQGVVIACVLKVALSLISKQLPVIRYAISSISMLACLVAPILTFSWFYSMSFAQQEANMLGQILAQSADSQYLTLSQEGDNWFTRFNNFLPYISLAWMACVTLLTVKLLAEVFMVNRLPYTHTVPVSNGLKHTFEHLVERLELTSKPKLIISLKTEVPMAIGWIKPVVLLPANMLTGLTSAQLEMLILHELAHIRRHDYLVNFLQTIVEIALFFHPAVTWISKQMRQEREYCSDDIAVSHCGDPIAYAHTLADTASLCTKHRHTTIPSIAMAASGGDLKQRVVRLVDHQCTSSNDAGKWLAGTMLGLSMALIFAKQFITIPQINVTVGELSLFNSNKANNEVDEALPTSHRQLSESTIAQQLIAKQHPIESNRMDERTIVSATTVTEIAGLQQIDEPLNTQAVSGRVITSDSPTKDNKFSSATEIAPVAAVQPVESKVTTIASSTIDNNVDLSTANVPQANVNLAAINAESALDALSKSSQLSHAANPYQDQINELALGLEDKPISSELANEPVTLNAHLFELPKEKAAEIQADFNQVVSTPSAVSFSNSVDSAVSLPVKYEAELINAPDPRYPSIAKRKGIELDVQVNFTIGKDGRIYNIEFTQRNKVSYFRNSIISAMKQWRFLPAQLDGQPIESQMSKIFSFHLN